MQIQSILSEWLVAIIVAMVVVATLVLLRLGVLDRIFGSPKEKAEIVKKAEARKWDRLYKKHFKRYSKRRGRTQ